MTRRAGCALDTTQDMLEQPICWVVKRNCSASPAQLAAVFASLVGLSFLIGVAFAAQGQWLVLPFVGVEVLAVVAAFVCYGRHAADYERVTVSADAVTVERASGASVRQWQLPLGWTRIDLQESGHGAMRRTRVQLVSRQQRVDVGDLLPEAKRARFARELAAALRAAACA